VLPLALVWENTAITAWARDPANVHIFQRYYSISVPSHNAQDPHHLHTPLPARTPAKLPPHHPAKPAAIASKLHTCRWRLHVSFRCGSFESLNMLSMMDRIQNRQSSLEAVSSMEAFEDASRASNAHPAFEDASHAHSTSSSVISDPGKTCDSEQKTRDVEVSGRAPATPNAKTTADLLAPADSMPLESHLMKESGSKCLPTPFEIDDKSSLSSATASPPSAAGHAQPSAQPTRAKAASHSGVSETCKDLGKKKLCEYPGCLVQPTFNFPGERGGSHCGTHRLEGQIK
jgi:hypothetical protein